jgi:hypothetical protein
MEPRNIGRALGIGIRVAGRIAGQRVANPAPSAANPPPTQVQSVAAGPSLMSQARPQAPGTRRIVARTGANLSTGIAGLLRPFRRVGGVVWLEATGTFFLLFAALFALRLWQNWSGIGEVSRDFSIGAAVVFLYLGISSFWRARHR